MNGVLHWNKKYLRHCWWNETSQPVGSGGNLYYEIPYTLEPMCSLTQEMLNDIEKIVERLFKRDPDFKDCYICMACMAVLHNKATTDEYVTAIVVTENRKLYEKLEPSMSHNMKVG
jgi:hypothetical protein